MARTRRAARARTPAVRAAAANEASASDSMHGNEHDKTMMIAAVDTGSATVVAPDRAADQAEQDSDAEMSDDASAPMDDSAAPDAAPADLATTSSSEASVTDDQSSIRDHEPQPDEAVSSASVRSMPAATTAVTDSCDASVTAEMQSTPAHEASSSSSSSSSSHTSNTAITSTYAPTEEEIEREDLLRRLVLKNRDTKRVVNVRFTLDGETQLKLFFLKPPTLRLEGIKYKQLLKHEHKDNGKKVNQRSRAPSASSLKTLVMTAEEELRAIREAESKADDSSLLTDPTLQKLYIKGELGSAPYVLTQSQQQSDTDRINNDIAMTAGIARPIPMPPAAKKRVQPQAIVPVMPVIVPDRPENYSTTKTHFFSLAARKAARTKKKRERREAAREVSTNFYLYPPPQSLTGTTAAKKAKEMPSEPQSSVASSSSQSQPTPSSHRSFNVIECLDALCAFEQLLQPGERSDPLLYQALFQHYQHSTISNAHPLVSSFRPRALIQFRARLQLIGCLLQCQSVPSHILELASLPHTSTNSSQQSVLLTENQLLSMADLAALRKQRQHEERIESMALDNELPSSSVSSMMIDDGFAVSPSPVTEPMSESESVEDKIRQRSQQLLALQRKVHDRVTQQQQPQPSPFSVTNNTNANSSTLAIPSPSEMPQFLLDPWQFMVDRSDVHDYDFSVPSIQPLLAVAKSPVEQPKNSAALIAAIPVAVLPQSLKAALTAQLPFLQQAQQQLQRQLLEAKAQEEAAQQKRERKAQERQLKEAEKQKKSLRKHFLTALKNHRESFLAYHKSRLKSQQSVVKACLKNQEWAEKRRKQAEEKARKERMRALKENDMTAYAELLKEHKNDRLTHVLEQTEAHMRQLRALIKTEQQAQMHDTHRPKSKKSASEREMAERVVESGLTWAQKQATIRESQSLSVESSQSLTTESQSQSSSDSSLDFLNVRSRMVEQPKLLSGGELKDYQLFGLSWLVSLYDNKMNGILADEMGLGKTIQTIALFAYLMDHRNDQGPFLVICPLSTLNNWQNEFQRFTPNITAIVYHGAKAMRQALWTTKIATGEFHVLLTTYECIINKLDRPRLSSIDWHYIVIDEGHRIKNTESKLTVTLQQKYTSHHRLILSGTPLQNSLKELWSLLNFLLPSIFNSSENFEDWFSAPFQNAGLDKSADLDEEEKLLVINRLHAVLRPFLLRRLKSEVATQLPDKIEVVLKCELSSWQEMMYEQIKNKALSAVDRSNGQFRLATFSNTFMQLRKICNHPYLFYQQLGLNHFDRPVSLEIVRSSGKFALLHRMLPKLLRTGHRTLIFCQMTRVMDLLEEYLEWRSYKWLRLDGHSTAHERKEALEAFNNESSPYHLFLLSTRAGGLGLNLQTADTVIIFDSDWNPQQDIQAQDRAHRIGQKREVRVFRLISMSPVEEEILNRARFKLGMDQIIIQSGKFNTQAQSSEEERKSLLQAVLREGIKHGPEVRAPSDEDFNEMMARTEDELVVFEQVDREIDELDRGLWRESLQSAIGRNDPIDPSIIATIDSGPPSRLVNDKEIPPFIKASEQLVKVNEKGEENLGRGNRRSTTMDKFYIEELSDKAFIRALERGEDPYELAARKQEQRILEQQGILISASGRKKRGRKPKNNVITNTEIELLDDEDVDGESQELFAEDNDNDDIANGRSSSPLSEIPLHLLLDEVDGESSEESKRSDNEEDEEEWGKQRRKATRGRGRPRGSSSTSPLARRSTGRPRGRPCARPRKSAPANGGPASDDDEEELQLAPVASSPSDTSSAAITAARAAMFESPIRLQVNGHAAKRKREEEEEEDDEAEAATEANRSDIAAEDANGTNHEANGGNEAISQPDDALIEDVSPSKSTRASKRLRATRSSSRA